MQDNKQAKQLKHAKHIKQERQKEAEQNVYLDGIEHLITQIHGQNTSNMNLYNENMTTLVTSLKYYLPKIGVKADGNSLVSSPAVGTARMAR